MYLLIGDLNMITAYQQLTLEKGRQGNASLKTAEETLKFLSEEVTSDSWP